MAMKMRVKSAPLPAAHDVRRRLEAGETYDQIAVTYDRSGMWLCKWSRANGVVVDHAALVKKRKRAAARKLEEMGGRFSSDSVWRRPVHVRGELSTTEWYRSQNHAAVQLYREEYPELEVRLRKVK